MFIGRLIHPPNAGGPIESSAVSQPDLRDDNLGHPPPVYAAFKSRFKPLDPRRNVVL